MNQPPIAAIANAANMNSTKSDISDALPPEIRVAPTLSVVACQGLAVSQNCSVPPNKICVTVHSISS